MPYEGAFLPEDHLSLFTWAIPMAASYLGLKILKKKVGDARVVVRPELVHQSQIYYYPDGQHALLTCRIPMKNVGKQQALVIDAHAFLQPAGDRFSDLQPVCRLVNHEAPRADGYWEGYIISIGEEMTAEIRLHLTSSEGIAQKVAEMGSVRFDLHYNYYCRTPLKYNKLELVLPVDSFEVVSEMQPMPQAPAGKPKAPIDPEATVVPLRTHLIRAGESVLETVQRYAGPVGRPGDIVILAETVVAIMQNRMAYCEEVRPRWLACQINFLFGQHSSLSSPYALEMAMREVGVARILLATAAGILGKITRRPGDFYRLAGRAVAAIDDCTGTLPPFDKYVVMGPANGDRLVAEVKEKTGFECAIVDANDLGKVDIFHISDPARSAEVVEALKPNPQGNAAEMTPLVLIRKR